MAGCRTSGPLWVCGWKAQVLPERWDPCVYEAARARRGLSAQDEPSQRGPLRWWKKRCQPGVLSQASSRGHPVGTWGWQFLYPGARCTIGARFCKQGVSNCRHACGVPCYSWKGWQPCYVWDPGRCCDEALSPRKPVRVRLHGHQRQRCERAARRSLRGVCRAAQVGFPAQAPSLPVAALGESHRSRVGSAGDDTCMGFRCRVESDAACEEAGPGWTGEARLLLSPELVSCRAAGTRCALGVGAGIGAGRFGCVEVVPWTRGEHLGGPSWDSDSFLAEPVCDLSCLHLLSLYGLRLSCDSLVALLVAVAVIIMFTHLIEVFVLYARKLQMVAGWVYMSATGTVSASDAPSGAAPPGHRARDWHKLRQVQVRANDARVEILSGQDAKGGGRRGHARCTSELPRVAVRKRWRRLQELRRRRNFWRRKTAVQSRVLPVEHRVGAHQQQQSWGSGMHVMHVQDISGRICELRIRPNVMVNVLVIACLVYNTGDEWQRGSVPADVLVGNSGWPVGCPRLNRVQGRSKCAEQSLRLFCKTTAVGRKFRCNTDGDGPLPAACDSTGTGPSGNERHAGTTQRESPRQEDGMDIYAMATLNVNGRMRLVNKYSGAKGASEDWGNGRDLKTSISPVWKTVERKMDGRSLVVLTDIGVTSRQMKAMGGRLSLTGPWKVHGTPGKFSSKMARVVAGVLIVWDERRFVLESKSILLSSRIVQVKLQDVHAGNVITVVGAYMPTRDKSDDVIRAAWDVLGDAVAGGEGSVIVIMGDLNAEGRGQLGEARRRETLADAMFSDLVECEGLVDVGPGGPTFVRNGANTRIDHILADEELAGSVVRASNLDGISDSDHTWIEIHVGRSIRSCPVLKRAIKLPLWEVTVAEWKLFEDKTDMQYDELVVRMSSVDPAEDRPDLRLDVLQALLVSTIKQEAPALANADVREQAMVYRGGTERSATDRLQGEVQRWTALRRALENRQSGHWWFDGIARSAGRRNLYGVRVFQRIVTDASLAPDERRAQLIQACDTKLHKANDNLRQLHEVRGDEVLQQIEEAMEQGGEGGGIYKMFEILRNARGTGARKSAKPRGVKQEGKRRNQPSKPPVLLSALYRNDDRNSGDVVCGCAQVLEEVCKIETKINGVKESFPGITRELMGWLEPFPEQPTELMPAGVGEAPGDWTIEVCTLHRFDKALRKTGVDVGVGSDAFTGYLVRKAAPRVRQLYLDVLRCILRTKCIPKAWKEWYAVLALKPGEDPRELGRRRDLWLTPHSLKLAARMLMMEMECTAVANAVPGSQAGFTANANAAAQTLVLRAHRESCRERKRGYYVAFVDMGTFFMSICHEIAQLAERWSGVRPEVTDILLCMQDQLHGRVETAYGLTEAFPMPGVACGQGHECSPTRSKLVMRFIQEMVSKVCRGYQFRQGAAVPQVIYADDGAFLAEDVAGIQLALDAVWMVARVSGLNLIIKENGKKTAWMGTYYDNSGVERDVEPFTRNAAGQLVPLVVLPDGRVVPQVTHYVHLGTPLQSEWKGRFDEGRRKMISKCKQLIGLLGRVEGLGPKQLRKALDLIVGGVLGYYGRATPMTFEACEEIERETRRLLERAGVCPAEPALPTYVSQDAGGLGHTHAYQWASAAYVDQIHRALNGGVGEPVRRAITERLASTAHRRGCNGMVLTWHPAHLVEQLDEEDLTEVWHLMKVRASVRVCRTVADLDADLEVRADDWKGATARLHALSRSTVDGDDGRAEGRFGVMAARRTSVSLGGWEYLIQDESDGGLGRSACWMSQLHMEGEGWKFPAEALARACCACEVPYSFRNHIVTTMGAGERDSVGRAELALVGKKSAPQTEMRLRALLEEFKVYAARQASLEWCGTDGARPGRWNMVEVPRGPGYKGSRWGPCGAQGSVLYYDGEDEEVRVVDAETGHRGAPATRSCIGLGKKRCGGGRGAVPSAGVGLRRVSADEFWARVTSMPARLGQQGHHDVGLPPYEEVDVTGGGLWAMGGGGKGYVALDDQRVRSDPVLRLFIRDPELESRGGWRRAQSGRRVTMSGANKKTMFVERAENGQSQGSFESKRALLQVCLPLHDEHCFTRAAFTDGACDDTRSAGGQKRRTASFGVWEGVFDDEYMRAVHAGWDGMSGNDKVVAALARGMWGGALPPDWQSIEAEMYAILAFLRRVSVESTDPGSERVLVISDCKSALQSIQRAWEEGGMFRHVDRGGMLEAICEIRRLLGTVVFVWCPGHRGISGNEYADMVACAHAYQPDDLEIHAVGLSIAERVISRDCVYEVLSEYGGNRWVPVDRRCFRMMRYHSGRWVTKHLQAKARGFIYDAALVDKRNNYGAGGICTEVLVHGVRMSTRLDPRQAMEQMDTDRYEVGLTMSMRVGAMDLPHDAPFQRRVEDEADPGGPYHRQAGLGCPSCRPKMIAVCEHCGGWTGRARGVPPWCPLVACPGNGHVEWVHVSSTRRAARVRFMVSSVSERRKAGPRRKHAGAHQHMTTAERLRGWRHILREEAEAEPVYSTGAPLASLRHVLTKCAFTTAASGVGQKYVEEVASAAAETARLLSADDARGAGEACAAAFRGAQAAVGEEVTTENWLALRKVLGFVVPEVGRGLHPAVDCDAARERLICGVREGICRMRASAASVVRRWKVGHAREMQRRKEQEGIREIIRIVIRSWREWVDGRRARMATRPFRAVLPLGEQHPEGGLGCLDDADVTGANRGTWIRLVLDSFRLVQHDAIASRMREKHDGRRHEYRLRQIQLRAEAQGEFRVAASNVYVCAKLAEWTCVEKA